MEEKIDSVPPPLAPEEDVLEEADKADLDINTDGNKSTHVINLDNFGFI